ncbi:MAG TPA: DUF2892 domain-containing protein [Phycisphaerales bacterium]|nr:DUF2892 domain-containing protein [Phycisphaerales bacterium]
MIATTATRVAERTEPEVNRRIEERADRRIGEYSMHPDRIEHRLRELDAEWDIERALQTNFAAVVLLSTALGAFVDRRWLLLGGAAAGFMIQHSLQGWCPPLPIFRRLGVRTAREIEEERRALLRIQSQAEAPSNT